MVHKLQAASQLTRVPVKMGSGQLKDNREEMGKCWSKLGKIHLDRKVMFWRSVVQHGHDSKCVIYLKTAKRVIELWGG